MKKIVLLIGCWVWCLASFAQGTEVSDKEKSKTGSGLPRVEVVRDRLNVDIFHSFWLGTPSQGNFNKFNPGFNVSAMWDFKLPQTPSLSFGLGLGFSYYTQFSNCIIQYDRSKGINLYSIISDNVEYKLNRVTYMNCHIPFEFRYRHANGFKVSVGIHVGLVAGFEHRYKGNNFNGVEGEYLNYKNMDFYNKQKFSADVYMRMGWKSFAVFYSYQFNKVFDAGKGPKMNPMSVGLSISLF